VALMQPQANQQRIIIRSSLSPTLPPVVADARSVRQIVLNLLSNSIKFTGAGGQVIVSTALTDRAEAVLRVRDTGIGMTDKEIETAMEPFRQLATSTRWGSGGTGLGLPLTKALAEANHAAFAIKSARNAGTLVEITFPGARVLAEKSLRSPHEAKRNAGLPHGAAQLVPGFASLHPGYGSREAPIDWGAIQPSGFAILKRTQDALAVRFKRMVPLGIPASARLAQLVAIPACGNRANAGRSLQGR